MDQVFARCVDLLALSGPLGATLTHVTAAATAAPHPRPALLRFLSVQFHTRPTLFSSPDWTQPPHTLHLIACESLRNRALGYSVIEHPVLPEQAWRVLIQVGRAGPNGILQSKVAPLVSLSAVMVSHYLGTLTARRLVARKRVVLTTTKLTSSVTHENAPAEHPNLSNQPQLISPSDLKKRITSTTVIVLARFASHLASSNASIPTNTTRIDPTRPPVDPLPSQSNSVPPNRDADVAIHELDVNQGADRVLRALQQPPYIRTQKDLKTIALPDHERPKACTVENFQRRRHRAFRAFRVRLEKAKLVTVVDRECIDINGNSRGSHSCLMLANIPHTNHGANVVAPVVVEDEEAVAAVEDFDMDEDNEGTQPHVASPRLPISIATPPWKGSIAEYIAEVDLVQQVYNLVRESGASGLSVPQIASKLDAGTKLLSTHQKRIRNIINGMSRFVPFIESQKFDGSAMSLKIVLAEFAPKKLENQEGSHMQECETSLIGSGKERKTGRTQRTSNLPRKRNKLTSLGVQRRNLLLQLLDENKAIVLETLGRRIAERETESSVDRVDQKVLRRIINDLVLQKKVQVLTTLKPSIQKRAQTLRLVTLPGLKADSPEVAHAVSVVVSQSVYGKQNTPRKPRKRKAEDVLIPEADEVSIAENASEEKTKKQRRSQPQERLLKDSKMSNPASIWDTITEGGLEGDIEQASQSASLSGAPRRDPIVVHKERRNMRNTRIYRLTAIDYGWMKGKLARARKFHEHLYQQVCKQQNHVRSGTNALQHISIENARAAPALGRFTIQSCLLQMSVADYAAVVGIHQDHGEALESVQQKKISEVEDILKGEIASSHASRQLTSLVQNLMKLELMKSAQGGKFALAGSGIIRDFGKGMPTAVFPHGVLFTCRTSVDLFWKELQQFAHFEHRKPVVHSSLTGRHGDERCEAGQHALPDVYIRMRWGKAFGYTFTQKEQLQYEVVLQRMSGVPVEMNHKENAANSLIKTGCLKRFDVGDIIDHAQKVAPALGSVLARLKNTVVAEKLLFYSRFRSRNEMPKDVFEHLKTEEVPSLHQASTTSKVESSGGTLRLSRGAPSVIRPAVATRRPKRLQKRSTRPASKTPPRRQLLKRDPETELVIDIQRFVTALGVIVKRRAKTYCNDVLVVPRWFDSENCSDSKTISLNKRRSEKHCSPRKATLGETQERKSNKRGSQLRNQSGHLLLCDLDHNMVSQNEEYPSVSISDKLLFPKAIATLCDSQIVQGVIDLVSLRLVLRLKSMHAGESAEQLEKRANDELQMSSESLAALFRTAVVECRDELYSRHKIVLDETTKVPSRLQRKAVFEREFQLSSNMRMSYDDSVGDQLTYLVERYRCISNLKVRDTLWREFVFLGDTVDDVMSSSEDDATHVRVEVMEQILLSVLNSGRQTQKSSHVMSLLNRFRQKHICNARDRLLLRGAIHVTSTDTMERFFMTRKGEPGGRESSLRHVLQQKSNMADLWASDLEKNWAEAKDKGLSSIGKTKLGKDAAGKRCSESRKAAMTMTEMVFYSENKRRRLRLKPYVGFREEDDMAIDSVAEKVGPGSDRMQKTVEGIEKGGAAKKDNGAGQLKDKEKKRTQKKCETQFGGSSSDGEAKEEDTGKNCGPKTVIDVSFRYEEDVRAGAHGSGSLGSCKKEVFAKVEDGELEKDVEDVIMEGKHLGMTIRELLESRVGQGCKWKLARAVQGLLRKGMAHRLSIETDGHPMLPGEEWNSSDGVLYMHANYSSALMVHRYKMVSKNQGRTEARLACIWRTCEGNGCETLASNVRQSVMNQVMRNPGMEVISLVKVTQARFPSVTARAVFDLLFILERRGALTVRRAVKRKRSGGLGGPFGGSGVGGVGPEVEEGAEICKRFVDGRGFVNAEQGLGKWFLHVVPERSLTEVSAEELCEVGVREW